MSMDVLGALRRSTLSRNVATLYASHLTGLLVPLVTVPYLARVLRPDGFGLVVFAQSVAAWLILVLEYAFDLAGTRAVARARHSPEAVRDVVAGIQGARLLLLVLVTTLATLLYVVVPLLRQHPLFLAAGWAYAVTRGLSPFWYFLGMERVRVAAALDAAAKVAAALGVFAWVHDPSDGWHVLALQAGAASVSLCLMTAWMYRDVPFRRPALARSLDTLGDAWGVFLSRASSGLYIQANAFVLGLVTTPQIVGFFGGAEKIIRAAVNLLNPLSQAFFPRLSHLVVQDPSRARQVFRHCLVAMVGLGTVMGTVAFVGAGPLVSLLLGPGYETAVPVLRMLAPLPVLVALSTVFGLQWALPLGLDRPFYRLVLAGGALNLVLAVILAPRLGALGMAISVMCADLLVATGLIVLFADRGFPRVAGVET